MPAAPGQKTFLSVQQEISEEVWNKSILDATDRPTLTRLKQIINDSYREICSMWDWQWLYDVTTVVPATGDTSPTALSTAAERVEWMAIPNGGGRLKFLTDNQWSLLTFGQRFTNFGNSRPKFYVEAPYDANNGLQVYFFPAADQAYTVQYRFKKRVSDLSASGDTPFIPPEFQDMWVYLCLMKVYKFLGADYKERFKDNLDLFTARRNAAILASMQTPDGAITSRYTDEEAALAQALNLNASLWFGGG